MRHLIAFPILLLAVILQSAVVSRITLLSGFADLPLVLVIAWALQPGVTTAWHWALLAGIFTAFVSGLPVGVPLIGFLLATWLAQALRRRIWQAPLLAMLTVTFLASVLYYSLSFLVLWVLGASVSFSDSLSQIILPGVLLNLFLALPVFWLARDLALWLYPVEEEA